MNEGANIVVLTDEEGNNHEFEHLDTIELNSQIYMAFVPAGIPEDSDEPAELILLKLTKDETGEEILATIDDDKELEEVYNAFMEEIYEFEEDENEEE
jgi:uncharacterized protein YrzB (UPF0473 family)